jgi:hypothetical protein
LFSTLQSYSTRLLSFCQPPVELIGNQFQSSTYSAIYNFLNFRVLTWLCIGDTISRSSAISNMSLDLGYIFLVSGQLVNFEQHGAAYRIQCPYCQFQKKQAPSKSKGFFYQKNNDWQFKCHKCGTGKSLANFLKENFPEHYLDYVKDRDRVGSTGHGTNCPTLETVLKDLGIFPNVPPSFHKDQESIQKAAERAPEAPTSRVCPYSGGDAPKITKLPPMRCPQQQAGHQAKINAEINRREKKRRNQTGELW